MEGIEYCERKQSRELHQKKDANERVAQGEDEVEWIRKEYSEDLYSIDNEEQVAVYKCAFDGIR